MQKKTAAARLTKAGIVLTTGKLRGRRRWWGTATSHQLVAIFGTPTDRNSNYQHRDYTRWRLGETTVCNFDDNGETLVW